MALWDPECIYVALRWFAIDGMPYYRSHANYSPVK